MKTALLVSGSGDDTLISRLMDGADGFIASAIGRDFAGGTFTELHAAGGDTVFLRNFPVVSITGVKVDADRVFGAGTLRATDTYVVLADRGVIRSLTGPFLAPRGVRDDWPAAVQVVYGTATSAVPTAVKEAFTQLVGHWYRQAKTFADSEQQLLVERAADGKVWSWGLTSGLKIPPTVLTLLMPFRVPPV